MPRLNKGWTPVSLAGQPGKLNADQPRLQDSVAKPLCNLILSLILEAALLLSSDHLIIQIILHVVTSQEPTHAGVV